MIQKSNFIEQKSVFLLLFIICVIMFGGMLYYTHTLKEQTTQEIKAVKQQVEQTNSQLEYLRTEINVLNNQLKHQEDIIEKTSGRLYKEHIETSEFSNRGSRPTVYTFKVKSPCTVTAFELNNVLAGTGLEDLGGAFVKAELTTGVNALFLTSLAIIESGWGNSDLAQNKNNLFGFGAVDSNPYGGATNFATKEECIMHVAQFIADNYCDENGPYFTNGTIAGMNEYYASNDNWGNQIFSTIITLNREAKS